MITVHNELINVLWPKGTKPKKASAKKKHLSQRTTIETKKGEIVIFCFIYASSLKGFLGIHLWVAGTHKRP